MGRGEPASERPVGRPAPGSPMAPAAAARARRPGGPGRAGRGAPGVCSPAPSPFGQTWARLGWPPARAGRTPEGRRATQGRAGRAFKEEPAPGLSLRGRRRGAGPAGPSERPGRAGPTRGGGSTRPAGKAPSRRRSQPGAGPGAGSCSTPGLAPAPPAALGTERTGRVGHFAGNFSLFPYFLPARGQVQQLLGLPPRGFRPEWESPALGFWGNHPTPPPIPILPGGGPSFPTSCCQPEGSARAHS